MAKTQNKARNYTVVLEPAEEGGYIVHVPALPGCHTQAETVEEAETYAKEAIECYLLALQDLGEEILEERPGATVITVAIDISLV
ncbi:MAG: type II toxin-antitoxin system HicB family antitoxin [Patescibacteria group bacterium]